jgi:RHS repeat-associated protein
MKAITRLIWAAVFTAAWNNATAQITTNLDLSSRWIGAPPAHETPSSAASYIQHPTLSKLEIVVTNFYAATNAPLEVDIGNQRQVFYGAGVDNLGNYIPTNYAPVVVELELRRTYQVHVSCANSGGLGSPLYKFGDLDTDSAICTLTNGPCYYSSPALAAFIWGNLTPQDQSLFTNTDPNLEPERQTNLVTEMNRIITILSLNNSSLLTGVSLGGDTLALMAKNPTGGAQLAELNRLILRDAFGWLDPINSQSDYLSGTAQIRLFVQPPPEFTINKTKPADKYSVILNGNNCFDTGDGGAELDLLPPTDGGYLSTNTASIEILKGKFAHYGVGDGCDDPRPAPGVGSWLSIGPGVTQDTNRISIDWSVSLGRTFDGLAAGRITLRQQELSSMTYTPYALFYDVSSTNILSEITVVTTNVAFSYATNVSFGILGYDTQSWYPIYGFITNITTNTDAVLRQIKACQTFVDIAAPDANHTVLNFYLPGQVATNQDAYGVFTNISGNPFVTWTIENTSPGDTNNLYILESRNGTYTTQSLVRTVNSGTPTWTLTLGVGPKRRVETRQVSFAGSTTATDRIEWDTIYNGSTPNAPAYQCRETYHFYPWGSELKETRIPNTAGDLVTTYDYYTDTGNPGYGQLEQIVYPDGYWEKREYWVSASDGYGDPYMFVPLRVLHPYFDGTDGGASSPDSATLFNSAVEDVWAPKEAPSPIVSDSYPDRAVMTIDHDKFIVNEYSDSDDYGVSEGPVTLSGSGKIGVCNGWDGTWENSSVYNDSAAPGLSGHTFSSYHDMSRSSYFYYDHGIYNPQSASFVVDSANHLYTWAGLTNNYPDHRQTEIDTSSTVDYEMSLNSLIGELNLVADNDAYWAEDTYSFEDHPNTSQVGLNTSRMINRIIHSGNLAQTEMYVYAGAGPAWALLEKLRYYTDSFGRVTNITRIDAATSAPRTVYTADYRGTSSFDGELLLSETDEMGQIKSYTYDSLQRVRIVKITGHGSQPDHTITYAYDANGRITSQTDTAGTLSQVKSWAYDLAGRVTNQVDQSGIATQTSYSADNQTVTMTSPGGVTTVQQQALDRYPTSVQGSGVVAKYYTHGTDVNNGTSTNHSIYFAAQRQQTTYLGHANSPRWHLQGTDPWGNSEAFDERPAAVGTGNTIWTSRLYWKNFIAFEQTSSGFPASSYAYDFSGNLIFKETSGTQNRITWTKEWYVQLGGNFYLATTNFVFLQDDNDTPTVSSVHLEQLNGFTGNEIACTIDYDADGNVTTNTTYLDRVNNIITTVTTEPNTSSLSAQSVYQNGLLISASTLSVASPTLYFYDALGRTNQITSPLGNSTYMTYDPSTGWMTSMTDPAGNTTFYTYYAPNQANAGKLQCQTGPTGKKTYYAYTTQGQLYRTWGDVPYPAQYQYSEYGDLTNLITFRGGSGWNSSTWPANSGTGDNTYWQYDDACGSLLKKIDAQNNATTYTYYPETGRLFTRSWQRTVGSVPVTVTNFYDTTYATISTSSGYTDEGQGFGDLREQDYNDGTPTVKFLNYSRADLPRQIVDATGTNDFIYDYANRLVSVTGERGIYSGVTVTNHFNPYYGRDRLKVTGLSSSIEDDFMYDNYGRLNIVGSGACSAIYTYVPNSDLLQTTAYSNNGNPVMTSTRSWQYGFRLSSIANVVNASTITSHSYAYDALNRRTRATLEDSSLWSYNYDDRDELTGANRYWYDAQSVSGQQFGYSYDNIGNRTQSSVGSQPATIYTANNVDQYTGILTPGLKEICGAALATNSVAVNSGTADRHGEYFHRQISVANSGGPIWQSVTNSSGGINITNGTVCPANSQTLSYDADGNLSFDGIWVYQWDGENRLISMTMTNVSGIASSNRLQLKFAYDFMGRRVGKIVSTWNGTAFVSQSTNYFVYDGWNLIAVFNPQSSILQSFMWGNDLSGTMNQAGGVGGLLMAVISNTNCFAAYDGNGNITALINAADSSTAARYEYSPYGELIRATGLLARQNPFRFSTEFWDDESGLIFYGYRFYSPTLGRWISRDPSDENDNLNIYGFVHNSPIMATDVNGGFTWNSFSMRFGQSLLKKLPSIVREHFNPGSFSTYLSKLALGGISDMMADIFINPSAALDMLSVVAGMEVQNVAFMQNAQGMITDKLNTKIAKDTDIGVGVGINAAFIGANGGNADDYILNASLNAAGTMGVDSAETIFGVASDIAD